MSFFHFNPLTNACSQEQSFPHDILLLQMKDGSRVPKNGEDSRKTVPTSQKTKSKVKTDL